MGVLHPTVCRFFFMWVAGVVAKTRFPAVSGRHLHVDISTATATIKTKSLPTTPKTHDNPRPRSPPPLPKPAEAPAVSFVCEGLRRVFETHGATSVAPPTIRPQPPPSLAAPPAASKELVRLLDHRGAVVTLPGNLTAPFARFVARSGVTRLKRYQIDRIFLAVGPERSCTEAWEADFDIISSAGPPSSSLYSSPSPYSGYSAASAAVVGGGVGRGGGGASAEDPTGGEGGGQGGGHFEVAEAEAVLVVSQVMDDGYFPVEFLL